MRVKKQSSRTRRHRRKIEYTKEKLLHEMRGSHIVKTADTTNPPSVSVTMKVVKPTTMDTSPTAHASHTRQPVETCTKMEAGGDEPVFVEEVAATNQSSNKQCQKDSDNTSSGHWTQKSHASGKVKLARLPQTDTSEAQDQAGSGKQTSASSQAPAHGRIRKPAHSPTSDDNSKSKTVEASGSAAAVRGDGKQRRRKAKRKAPVGERYSSLSERLEVENLFRVDAEPERRVYNILEYVNDL